MRNKNSCLSQLFHSSFFPFLNIILQKCNQWVSFGAIWNWLFLTWGQLLVSSHKGHTCATPTTKTVQCKLNTLACA